jgi:hypothetical protein
MNNNEMRSVGKFPDMVDALISEVLMIVDAYSTGSEVWTIYNGVDAWEVLLGYKRADVTNWLLSVSQEDLFQIYQDFILRWNCTFREPVRKTSNAFMVLVRRLENECSVEVGMEVAQVLGWRVASDRGSITVDIPGNVLLSVYFSHEAFVDDVLKAAKVVLGWK